MGMETNHYAYANWSWLLALVVLIVVARIAIRSPLSWVACTSIFLSVSQPFNSSIRWKTEFSTSEFHFAVGAASWYLVNWVTASWAFAERLNVWPLRDFVKPLAGGFWLCYSKSSAWSALEPARVVEIGSEKGSPSMTSLPVREVVISSELLIFQLVRAIGLGSPSLTFPPTQAIDTGGFLSAFLTFWSLQVLSKPVSSSSLSSKRNPWNVDIPSSLSRGSVVVFVS